MEEKRRKGKSTFKLIRKQQLLFPENIVICSWAYIQIGWYTVYCDSLLSGNSYSQRVKENQRVEQGMLEGNWDLQLDFIPTHLEVSV